MSKANPAVFLDRDGVINKDNGYVSQIDDFEFIEGVIEACLALKEKGYKRPFVCDCIAKH